MTILDSNIWIAFFNKNDNQHRKASLIFSKIKDEILISEYIVLEVCTVLAIRVNKKIADNFLEIVLHNQDVQILPSSSDFFHKSIKNFLDYKHKDLSFVDISLLNLAKNYKLLTFDKKLEKAITNNTD